MHKFRKHRCLGEEPSDASLKGIIEKYKADYPENPI